MIVLIVFWGVINLESFYTNTKAKTSFQNFLCKTLQLKKAEYVFCKFKFQILNFPLSYAEKI